ncbi:hypothetical protein [Streptomyces sp. NPDC051561]|uniref:hypothetical protein n=1 Tax=Streptomyces sp. NPDC051561 TaxID=3365658 RepID=UPI0037B5B92D
MVNPLARIVLVAATAAAVFVTAATPALAADVLVSNKVIKLPGGRGSMTFIDDGDMFQVCDTKADGHGVAGRLIDNDYNQKLYITDGGDANCGKDGYNVGQSGSYQMQLSWNGDGYEVKSEWFNE